MHRRREAFTLLELLVVLAMIGIVAAIGVTNGRRIAERQAARGALATVQQSVWQGATSAASRGRVIELRRGGDGLVLLDVAAGEVLRGFELPDGAALNAVDEPLLRFLPPGKVDLATLDALPDELVLDTGEERYRLEISLIGEVFAEAAP